MTAQLVKAAEGRRVRDPKSGKLLPNVADTEAEGVLVDLAETYWFRADQAKDIVTVDESGAVVVAKSDDAKAPASTAAPTASSTAPAVATPAASASTPAASTAPAAKSA